MSVKVRRYKRGGWEVDVTVRLPNGSRFRERSRTTVRSRSAAARWGEDRERHLLQNGPPQPRREVPTLSEFADRFLDGHVRANRQKASGLTAKESILRVHLLPLFGSRRLDTITTEQVQQLKHNMTNRKAKTVNNTLTVLNTLLKKAVEWDVIDRMPCSVRLLAAPKPTVGFYHFDEYGPLIDAARDLDASTYVIVVERAVRRAGLAIAGVHRLRHTFCSHLGMRGAPARAIQELAGHQELSTTQRYMHLSPATLESAIRLLESHVGPAEAGRYVIRDYVNRDDSGRRRDADACGDISETSGEGGAKS